MKVKLVAFDKLYSEVIEWPEETPMEIRLPLKMGHSKNIYRDADLTPMKTVLGKFEWGGYTESSSGARIYNLVSVD